MKKISILLCLTVFYVSGLKSQIIVKPNFGLKSHETLEVTRIESTPSHTTIFLTVENKITGGYFCADKNIFIIYPDGTRSKLLSSKGIPVCPDAYKFKTAGEKLNFELTFPPIKANTQWIDLVEDCQDNCFSFYSLSLNISVNKKIDEASYFAENNNPENALIGFIDLAKNMTNSGMEGLVYSSIIRLSRETGNDTKAKEWFTRLQSSDIPRKDLYLNNLKAQGIIY